MKVKKGSTSFPAVPLNEDSAATLLIIEHYRRIGILEGWNTRRFVKLARILRITVFELGRLCAIFPKPEPGEHPDHDFLLRLMRKNSFPPYISLTLSLIEDAALRSKALHEGVPLDKVQVLPLEDLLEYSIRKSATD